MLNDYQDKQPLAYNIMMNEIKNNHLSHAYLIDENDYSDSFQLVLSFVCEILCSNLSSEERTILSKRIYECNYPEFKVIEPDGMLIKKKQILDLQREFSLEAVEGTRRIYVIRDADKMRSETANSMLKFLEEPNSSIIAILMTNNYNGMLSTIVSRCQIIKLCNDGVNKNNNEYIELAINFVKQIETIGVRTILNVQDILFNIISSKERDKLILFFDKVIYVYYDIMKISIKSKEIKYSEYFDILSEIALKSNQNVILEKINYLVMAKETIKYNVNNNLLIDSVIVNLGGKYEGSWS